MLGLLLGGLRLALTQPVIDPDHVAFYRDRTAAVTVQGIVVAEPERRARDTRLRVKAEALILDDEPPLDVHGRLLVYAPVYTAARYGDRLLIQGRMVTPPVFEDFSYRDYLARRGIYALVQRANVTLLASHQANPVLDLILRFKTYAYDVLASLLPDPEGALLAGILLGIETGIPEEVQRAFSATGTSHIIAISGFNLTIVAGIFAATARRLVNRRWETLVALTGVWLYVVLVGTSAAVLRAGVMASLVVVAQHEQRKVHGPTSLAAAVLFLSLLDPAVLWDVGFQLSFAATLGMMLYVQPLAAGMERVLARWTTPQHAEKAVAALSDVLIVTAAVQVTTLGIMVYHFRKLSLITLPANLLVLPIQLFVMASGGLALLTGMVWRPLGAPFAWIAWVFLTLTIRPLQWLSRLTRVEIPLGDVTGTAVWGYYVLVGALTWWFSRSVSRRAEIWSRARAVKINQWAVAAVVALPVLIIALVHGRPDGQLHVVVLNAGEGEAIYIRTPNGHQALIDGGATGPNTLAALGRQMPFWDRTLDLVVLSAPVDGRVTGLVPVLERYDVTYVAYADFLSTRDDSSPALQRWKDLIARRPGGTHGSLIAGDTWTLDAGVRLDVLWPPPGTAGPLVLRVAYGDVRVLLPGEATAVVEAALVEVYGSDLHSQAIVVPRHAAKTALSLPFLRAVNPTVAAVSLAEDQSPADFVLARLMDIPLYQTNRHGKIDIVSDGTVLHVRPTRLP
jgi:competence protein ComEC